MPDPILDPVAWQNARTNSRILVMDGPRVKLSTRDGQLWVEHGPAGHQETVKIPKVPHDLDRVLILANFGFITIEAQRWLKDCGIPWTHIDRSGEILAISPPHTQDARLIRAQAYAPSTATGLDITRLILSTKLEGQAQIMDSLLGQPTQAEYVRTRIAKIQSAANIPLAMTFEGLAAEKYWKAWIGIPVPFGRTDAKRIPVHWLKFSDRFGLTGEKARNKNATDPINSMLNYLYAVASSECLHICHALNLSPVLGIIHADRPDRASFVYDLLETVRPVIDRIILENFLLTGEHLDRRLFSELRDGVVRLTPPLTHRLAAYSTAIGEAVSPYAYQIAHMLSRDATGVVTIPRPKTRVAKQTSYRGYPAARLRPGVRPNDVIPDQLWSELESLIPAHPQYGRPYLVSDRERVAILITRYKLRCSWRQCLGIASASVHKTTANGWWADWHKSGRWDAIMTVADRHEHWSGLTQDF